MVLHLKTKNMKNPLAKKYDETLDQNLIEKALSGNKSVPNKLIIIHEPFIYNVAWKFTNDQNEASDLTQEVQIMN